jgi:hypothetical protein
MSAAVPPLETRQKTAQGGYRSTPRKPSDTRLKSSLATSAGVSTIAEPKSNHQHRPGDVVGDMQGLGHRIKMIIDT